MYRKTSEGQISGGRGIRIVFKVEGRGEVPPGGARKKKQPTENFQFRHRSFIEFDRLGTPNNH